MYELGSDDSGLRIRRRLSNRNKSNHVFESDTASFSGAVMWFWEGEGGDAVDRAVMARKASGLFEDAFGLG